MAKHQGRSDKQAVVDAIITGGPADSSEDLQVGDVLLSIDGVDVCGMSEEYIRSRLAGPVGTPVCMTVRRNPEAQRHFEVTLVRRSCNARHNAAGQALEVSDCAHALFVELQQMAAKCATLSSDMQVQKFSVDSMRTMNDNLQADLSRNSQDMQQLRQQIEALQTELDHAQTSSKDLDQRAHRLLQERDTATKRLGTANEKIKQLNTLLDVTQKEAQAESCRHQQSAKERAGSIADLQSSITKHESSAILLKLEIERLQGESRRHRVESDSVKQQILVMQDANNELKILLMQSREENNRLLDHLESEKRRLQNAESKLTMAVAGSQRLDMEKADVSSTLADLEEKYQLFSAQLEAAEDELQVCRAEKTRLENDKCDLEAAQIEARASLEQALRETEALKQEADEASTRLKTELENAGDIVQHQAELHSSVLKEKGMVEAELQYYKAHAASLQDKLETVTKEAGGLQGRLTALEDALASEKATKQREIDTRTDSEASRQSLQDQIQDAMTMLDGEGAGTLVESVRLFVRRLQSKTQDVLRLDQELSKAQTALSQASVEVQRLHEMRSKDAQSMRELECDKGALESKVKELTETLCGSRESANQLTAANKTLAADLRETSLKAEQMAKRLISAQEENNDLSGQVHLLDRASSSQQAQLNALSAANCKLEDSLRHSTHRHERMTEHLAASEKALGEASFREMDLAQRLAAADKTSQHLDARNSALTAQLHTAVGLGRDLLARLSSLSKNLSKEVESFVEQGFAIEGLSNEVSRKDQALQDMGRSMEKAQCDRELLLAKTLQLEKISNSHMANVRRMNTAQETLQQLLEGASLAQVELHGVVMDLGLAMGMVEREIGHTACALEHLPVSHAVGLADVDAWHGEVLSSNDLVASLMQLQRMRQALDSGREALRKMEIQRSEEALANLEQQVAEADQLVAYFERNRSEIDTEKQEHEILSHKLQMAEERLLASELRREDLLQDVARTHEIHLTLKHTVGSAMRETLRLVADSSEQVGCAYDFFSDAHDDLLLLDQTLKEFFADGDEDLEAVCEGLHEQEDGEKSLRGQLVMALAVGGSMARDLESLEHSFLRAKDHVREKVHEISALVEQAKGEASEAAWNLESDIADVESLSQLRAVELDTAHKQVRQSQGDLIEREAENVELQQQLCDATALAEARKRELAVMAERMQQDQDGADRTLGQLEEAMRSMSLLRAELQSESQAREMHQEEARVAERDTQSLKSMSEQQITHLRGWLRAHSGALHERIAVLQAESEEIYTAITCIYKELGQLRTEFQREMMTLNLKVDKYDDEHRSMCETLDCQERELLRREDEAARITNKLEVLMDELRDGESRQRYLHAAEKMRTTGRMEDLQVHVAECLRTQRKLASCLHKWYRRARRQAWLQRVSATFQSRWQASTTLSSSKQYLRRWRRAARNFRRFVVTRWELLAVGVSVGALGSRSSRHSAHAGIRKNMQRILKSGPVEASDDSSVRSGRGSISSRSDGVGSDVVSHGMAALRLNLNVRRPSSQHSLDAHVSTPVSMQMGSSCDLSRLSSLPNADADSDCLQPGLDSPDREDIYALWKHREDGEQAEAE